MAGDDRKRRQGKKDLVKPRPIIIDPNRLRVVDPRTKEDFDRIVEEACRFIEQSKVRHGMRFAMQVGEHLYLNVYDANDAYLSRRDPRKTDSMYDIAARTGISNDRLRSWTIAAATRIKLERMGFTSDRLSMSHFAQLYRLKDNMELTRQFAAWVERERVNAKELKRRLETWREFIDRGGRFEDLELDPDVPTPPRPRRKPRPIDEIRVVRMLELVLGWIERTHLGPAQRKEILAILPQLRSLLARRAS